MGAPQVPARDPCLPGLGLFMPAARMRVCGWESPAFSRPDLSQQRGLLGSQVVAASSSVALRSLCPRAQASGAEACFQVALH